MTTALKWSAIGVLVVLGASALVVGALRWIDPPTTAFMLRQSGPVIQEWVPMEAISPTLVHAAVTSEDQRFYQHWGLDIAAIQTALEEGDRGGAVRGASTITQQVAKNLFLTPARNYFRKVAEAYLAVLVDLLWSKRRIMEVYLNIAQFGDNLFGVEAASRHYFGKVRGGAEYCRGCPSRCRPAQSAPFQSGATLGLLARPSALDFESDGAVAMVKGGHR